MFRKIPPKKILKSQGKPPLPLTAGETEIFVFEAKNLISRESNLYEINPYFVIFRNEKRIYRSKLKRATSDPVWNESVIVNKLVDKEQLIIEIYDRHVKVKVVHKDFFIGKVYFTGHDIQMPDFKNEVWVVLYDAQGEPTTSYLNVFFAHSEKDRPIYNQVLHDPVADISPSNTIRLHFNSMEQDAVGCIEITSTADTPVSFNMETNSPSVINFQPVSGIISPGQVNTVSVYAHPQVFGRLDDVSVTVIIQGLIDDPSKAGWNYGMVSIFTHAFECCLNGAEWVDTVTRQPGDRGNTTNTAPVKRSLSENSVVRSEGSSGTTTSSQYEGRNTLELADSEPLTDFAKGDNNKSRPWNKTAAISSYNHVSHDVIAVDVRSDPVMMAPCVSFCEATRNHPDMSTLAISSRQGLQLAIDTDEPVRNPSMGVYFPSSLDLQKSQIALPNSHPPGRGCFNGPIAAVSPLKYLIFDKATGSPESLEYIHVVNAHCKYIAVKVKVTTPEFYKVTPKMFTLAPGDLGEIKVYLQWDNPEPTRDRFLIIMVEVQDPNVDPFNLPRRVWANEDGRAGARMTHKLLVLIRRGDDLEPRAISTLQLQFEQNKIKDEACQVMVDYKPIAYKAIQTENDTGVLCWLIERREEMSGQFQRMCGLQSLIGLLMLAVGVLIFVAVIVT